MAKRQTSLEDFLQMVHVPNLYIRYKSINCYVRKGRCIVDGKIRNAITIANIANMKRRNNGRFDPNHKRTGLFSEFEHHVREMAVKYGYEGVYVELVHNEFLPDVLIRYGYQRVNMREVIPGHHEHNYWYCVQDNNDERRL